MISHTAKHVVSHRMIKPVRRGPLRRLGGAVGRGPPAILGDTACWRKPPTVTTVRSRNIAAAICGTSNPHPQIGGSDPDASRDEPPGQPRRVETAAKPAGQTPRRQSQAPSQPGPSPPSEFRQAKALAQTRGEARQTDQPLLPNVSRGRTALIQASANAPHGLPNQQVHP